MKNIVNVFTTELKYLNDEKYKYYLKIINKIEKIRSKNNVNWMNILKLAFKMIHVMHQRL